MRRRHMLRAAVAALALVLLASCAVTYRTTVDGPMTAGVWYSSGPDNADMTGGEAKFLDDADHLILYARARIRTGYLCGPGTICVLHSLSSTGGEVTMTHVKRYGVRSQCSFTSAFDLAAWAVCRYYP